MAVNSKNKGNTAERELSKIFSEVFGGSFIRTPASGAYIGGKNQFRKSNLSQTQIRASKSDIITPDEMPNLVIESKFYKDLPYHAFAVGQNIPLVDGWLKELEFDCDENDFGVLCFKTNRKPWSIAFKVDLLHKFKISNYIIYNGYVITAMKPFLDNNVEIIKELSK